MVHITRARSSYVRGSLKHPKFIIPRTLWITNTIIIFQLVLGFRNRYFFRDRNAVFIYKYVVLVVSIYLNRFTFFFW